MMSAKVGIVCVLTVLIDLINGSVRTDPIVETNVGRIKGVPATDGDYSMFLGIPFGDIDEAHPFSESTPHPPFDDTFEANTDLPTCIQLQQNNAVGQIDCLYLNVYVPNTASSSNRLPVMVWIYGGAFAAGNSRRAMDGPRFLVKHDVILVSISYRVGLYGFLCLNTPEVPGNQGLKDQRLALRWVKNNIEAFGGDSNKITIFGVSAGSKSVDFHVHLSKENLFQSAIMQSGTVLLPHLETEPDLTAPITLAARLGYNTTDLSQALAFISAADPAVLLPASRPIYNDFLPCYEKEIEGVESFLTDYSVNLEPHNVKGMNIMLGFVADEWLSRHFRLTDADYATWNNFRDELAHYFNFEENELEEMSTMMRQFYIGDEPIDTRVRFGLIDFDSDWLFNYQCERTIDKFFDYGANNIYYYMFSYVGERNRIRIANGINIGKATHGDETTYQFDRPGFPDPPSAADQLVIDRMTTMWTNFAKYGDPTPTTTDIIPFRWEAITSKDAPRYFVNFDTELTLERRPFNERFAFWDLFYKRNLKLQRGYKPREKR